jgi:transposase
MSNELSAQDLLPPEIGLTLLGFEKSEQGWLVHAGSNGPVEGHINRLKTLKRQMYGRAGFELLRA